MIEVTFYIKNLRKIQSDSGIQENERVIYKLYLFARKEVERW